MKVNHFLRLFLSLLMLSTIEYASAQYDTEHYIAPSGYTYYNEVHRIIISTLENNVTVRLFAPHDYYAGRVPLEVFQIVNGIGGRASVLSVSKGNPIEVTIPNRSGRDVLGLGGSVGGIRDFRFWGISNVDETGQAAEGEGLVVIASLPVSVNIRNLSGDRYLSSIRNPIINGNSSLTSKGISGLGTNFHLLNYRNLTVTNLQAQHVLYSVLATQDDTDISYNGVQVVTLNKGQYAVFSFANMQQNFGVRMRLGDRISATNPITLTISCKEDFPPIRCADAFADQMIPNQLAGIEYIAIRGRGLTGTNDETFEAINIVAIHDDTQVNINRNGVTTTQTLNAQQSFITTVGINNETQGPYTTSYIKSDKPILVLQASGQGCEHGISVLPPLSCTGSNHIETLHFPNVGVPNTYFPFDGYVLVKCATRPPVLNNVPLQNPIDIQGSSEWQLYRFNQTNLNNTNQMIIDNGTSLMHVGILQNGGLFGAYAYFSGFTKGDNIEIEYNTPSNQPILGEGCAEAKIIFKRHQQCIGENIQFNFSGTAIAGVDYETPATQNNGIITFGDELRKEVSIKALIDNEEEEDETIDIEFFIDTNCDGIKEKNVSRFTIRNTSKLTYESEDYEITCLEKICPTANNMIELTSNISGGTPPYKVTWQNGLIQNLTIKPYIAALQISKKNLYPKDGDNFYTFNVIDDCGVSIDGQVKLKKVTPQEMTFIAPEPTITCIDLYCNSGNDEVELTATIRGGTPPYTVTWEDGTEQFFNTSPAYPSIKFTKSRYIQKNSIEGVSNKEINYGFFVFDDCCTSLSGSVKLINQCGLCAPNVITPNGDQLNDNFVIQNIEQYQNTSIIIYNRWGETVYTSDNYTNDWNSSEVPESTYFYHIIPNYDSIIPREDGKIYVKEIKGNVLLIR